jgi:hypothetical protein
VAQVSLGRSEGHGEELSEGIFMRRGKVAKMSRAALFMADGDREWVGVW